MSDSRMNGWWSGTHIWDFEDKKFILDKLVSPYYIMVKRWIEKEQTVEAEIKAADAHTEISGCWEPDWDAGS